MSQLDKSHILIVDDSKTTRNTIASYLGENYIVLLASNGQEAWQLIKTNSSISLVFSDLHMPVMNGMALLKRIRSSKNDRVASMPVIMITGHEDTEAAKRASYAMGASEFISKPFSEIDIISRVRASVQFTQKIANLEKHAIYDDLTKFYNTHGFNQLGELATVTAMNHKHDLSVLSLQVVDVDDVLKKYGKKITSQIIIAVACTLKKSLRKDESLAHQGMGHFSMLMPSTKIFRAQIIATRLQQAVHNLAFKIGTESIRFNLAAGINSTEDYTGEITFNELTESAELAKHESLKDEIYRVVRYDVSLDRFSSTQQFMSTTIDEFNIPVPDQASSTPEIKTVAKQVRMIDSAVLSQYMMMIVHGHYDRIPQNDINSLLDPMKGFINYVQSQSEDTRRSAQG